MPISAAGNKRGIALCRRSAEPAFTFDGRSAEHGFVVDKRSAEHGFVVDKRSAEHGFTLVELMIVIVIIGLATAAVVWAMPDPRGRLADEAGRFAGRAKAARDLAIVGGRPVSLWVTSGGYGFEERRAGGWVAIGEKPLRVEHWGEGTVAALGDATRRDRVTFDSTGLTDHPVTLRLVRGSATTTVAIGGNGTIKVGT